MAIYIPAGSTFLCPLKVLLEPQTHTPNVLPDPPAQASKATSTVFSRDPVSPGPVCPIFSCAWTSNWPVVSSSRFVDPMASTTLRKKTKVLLVAWRARSGRSRPSRPPSSGLPGSSLPGPRRRSFRPASRFLSRASVFLLPRKLGHLGGASPHTSLDSRAPSWAPLFCVTWGSPSASELRNPSRGVPRPRPRGTARAAVLCVQRLRTCLRGGPERTPFSSAAGSLLLGLGGSIIAPPPRRARVWKCQRRHFPASSTSRGSGRFRDRLPRASGIVPPWYHLPREQLRLSPLLSRVLPSPAVPSDNLFSISQQA